MRHAVSQHLCAYWRGLSRGGIPPERSAIDPGAIRAFLADTFVLDFDPPSGFPFRICGSRVNSVFLKELRGASFLQIWRETDRDRVRAILEAAADEEAPHLLQAEAHPMGLRSVDVEVALLPLRHQGATHARMLGALSTASGADWLGLIGAAPATLTAWGRLEPATPARRGTAHPGTSTARVGFMRISARGGSRA